MYSIFIVDDEEIIRERIRNSIEKIGAGHVICGEASDGELALSMIKELKPDILVTDIKMPFVDGLELVALVKKSMPWIRIITISGHDEFEYAQKALSLGVDEYLLKPITSEQLQEALNKIRNKVEQEKELYRTGVQSWDWEERTILKEYFLSRVVDGDILFSEALEKAEQHGISLVSKYYCVCSIVPGESDQIKGIRFILGKLFEHDEDVIWFMSGSEQAKLILKGGDQSSLLEKAYETAQNIKHEMIRGINIDVTIGIGTVVSRLSELPGSYKSAKTAVKRFSELAHGQIGGINDIHESTAPFSVDQWTDYSWSEKIRHMTQEDIPDLVSMQFTAAEKDSQMAILYRYYLLMDLMVCSYRLLSTLGVSLPEIISRANRTEELLKIVTSYERTCELAEQILNEVLIKRDESSKLRYTNEIRSAREFIKENYSNESLSLQMVAEKVGFSPNHFSTIFSQQMGETFIEYLTKVRVEAGKHLLSETNLKTTEIAYRIGYNEPRYFNYIFKKHTGLSPKEFKASLQSK